MSNPHPVYTLQQGTVPLLVSMPHIGTHIPAELQAQYAPRALQVEDTDWHLHTLYNFLADMGASVLTPTTSRYVIDLHRPPDDAPMYPGAANTELCPTHFFTGEPLYQPGQAPAPEERLRRRETYWQPYHSALEGELARLKAQHGCPAVGCAQHSHRTAVAVRWSLARPEYWYGQRCQCRRPHCRRCDACQRRVPACQHGVERTLQRRLHHPPLRTAVQWHPCHPAGDVPTPVYARNGAFCV